MYKLKIRAMSVALFCLLFTKTKGQSPELKIKIGEPLPEFVFSTDDHRQTNLITNKNIQGKHTILYYWNKGCTACITSFIKVNTLQQKFKDRLNVIVVGLNFQKTDSEIKKIYEMYEKKWDLKLTSVYDTTFAIRNGIEDLPVIWVDDKGIVQAYNTSTAVIESNIQSFLTSSVILTSNFKKSNFKAVQKRHDITTPLMVNGNGEIDDDDFLFRSVLGKWKPGMVSTGGGVRNLENQRSKSISNRFRYEISGASLDNLFLFTLSDNPSLFQIGRDNYTVPIFEGENAKKAGVDSQRYFYSLIVPDSAVSRTKIREYVLQDLERYFACTATIEKRLLPCWVIKAEKGAANKLKSKGGRSAEKRSHLSEKMTNQPFSNLFYYLGSHAMGRSLRYEKNSVNNFLRVYNGTDIPDDFPVDLDLKTIFMDTPEHINQELKRYGLSIVRENRLQNALVIKDVQN